jgi:hypothetical protein
MNKRREVTQNRPGQKVHLSDSTEKTGSLFKCRWFFTCAQQLLREAGNPFSRTDQAVTIRPSEYIILFRQ